MQWSSWQEFWNMGGAAPFVWGSYALCLIWLIAELMLLRRKHKHMLQRLSRLHRLFPATGDTAVASEERKT